VTQAALLDSSPHQRFSGPWTRGAVAEKRGRGGVGRGRSEGSRGVRKNAPDSGTGVEGDAFWAARRPDGSVAIGDAKQASEVRGGQVEDGRFVPQLGISNLEASGSVPSLDTISLT
jgi:hypothetical protein